MDLGCLDLGCISTSDKHSTGTQENVASATKAGKNKSPKGTGQSTLSLNKFTSQIKKPPHRRTSPLNWFPRKKADSYLKRKIKLLQEIDGMNLTLDETLGDSNLHYSRVLKEKIAAREAAHTAMEARKAALVEASWCRILQASRIQSKEAEALLLKAEKMAAEAFEAATALGVIMYDTPNCPQKPSQIETSAVNGGRSTTHTVTASFETAFEVDKEVAAAVKTAFVKLVSCSSFNKDEVKELLCKIRQNPEMSNDNNQEFPEFSSEHESESGSEVETISQNDGFNAQDMLFKLPTMETRQRKYKRKQSLEKLNKAKLVDMMLERLKCLKEDELSSLATIVATCGLSAALAEVESSKLHAPDSSADCTSSLNIPSRISFVEAGTMRYSYNEQMRRMQVESEVSELPSLDKFLVKHMSKLEREVQEAKNSKMNGSIEENFENTDKTDSGRVNLDNNMTSHETIPNLGSILVKHFSKFEKEIGEAKKNSGKIFEIAHKKPVSNLTTSETIPDLGSILRKHSSKLEKELQEIRENSEKALTIDSEKPERAGNRASSQRKDVQEVTSLDKFLVKHVSRLEKEVQEAKNRRKTDIVEEGKLMNTRREVNSFTSISGSEKITNPSSGDAVEKENMDLNKGEEGKSMMDKKESEKTFTQVKTMNYKERETLSKHVKAGNSETEDSLDKILVKRVHGLEREKMQALSLTGNCANHYRLPKKDTENDATNYESLDKVLVKHVSRLEKEKMESSLKEEEVKVKTSGRNVHMPMYEEGGLDEILVKHKSRLEREKMAFSQNTENKMELFVSRKEARERELQEAWGGLSLGNSIRPHLSKLERDKAAWIKAEEEERMRPTEEKL